MEEEERSEGENAVDVDADGLRVVWKLEKGSSSS